MFKRFALRLLRVFGWTLESLGRLSHIDLLEDFGASVKHGWLLNPSACNYGMALEIDSSGEIHNSMHSPSGETCALSEVYELDPGPYERHFLLGSASNHYLGKLSLPRNVFDYSQQKQ